jgi:O-antigen ligase
MFKSPLKSFEVVFTVLSILHFSNGLLPIVLLGGASEGDTLTGGTAAVVSADLSTVRNVTYLIYLVAFSLMFLRWKKVLLVLQKDKHLWLFTIFISLSFLWSELPRDSLAAGITAFGATAFGLYLATRYTLEEQLELLSWTYVLIVILSLVFIVALPKYGIMGGIHEGAFRGIYTHKNIFGQITTIGAAVFLIRALSKNKLWGYNWPLWFFFSVSVGLVALSRSSTSILNLILVVFLIYVYRAFRWRYEILIPATLAGLFIGFISFVWLLNSTEFLLNSIGKDSTLTGRTELWTFVWHKIQEKPWLGYGLKGFWQGLDGPSQYVELGVKTKVVYSHNGFLDLWITIGIVGTIFFAVGLVWNLIKAFNWVRFSNSNLSLWPLVMLSYLILASATESPLITFNNLLWILYCTINFSLLLPRTQQIGLTTARA